MFGVQVVNNTGAQVTLKPDGNPASGVPRSILVAGFPFPISIDDSVGKLHVPQSFAVDICDGQAVNQIGYEGTGNIVITLGGGGGYSVSSGYGPTATGQMVQPIPTLPMVQNPVWSPDNPVYLNTVLTLSWDPVSGATSYIVQLWRDGAPIVNQTVTTPSVSYTLTSSDIWHFLHGTVCACSDSCITGDTVDVKYYAGNNQG